jgi:ATP-dependent Zn protease
MKTILKYAHALAIRGESRKLTLGHVRRALEGLVIKDEDCHHQLLKAIGVKKEAFRQCQIFTGDEINLADAHPTIRYDTRVQDIFIEFGEKVIPVEIYRSGQPQMRRLLDFKKRLTESVYEQGSAIEAVCHTMVKALYEPPLNRPRGIFFFLGPPATGKSFLAELIAKELGTEWNYKYIDMSDYQSDNEAFGLNGLRKGYSKSRPGDLTSFVREHPKSVIVFDELDKAHPNNQSVLLSILNKGELKDNFGFYEDDDPEKDEIGPPVVDFRNTIVIFTSNLGGEIYTNEAFLDIMADNPSQAEDIILESLRREKSKYFGNDLPSLSPGVLSRLAQGQIVLFNRLSFDALKRIAFTTFESVRKGLEAHFDVTVTMDHSDQLMEIIVLGLAPLVDARRVRARTSARLFDTATDFIMNERREIRHLHFTVAPDSLSEIREIMTRFGGQDPVRAAFRRNQSLRYETGLKLTGDRLTVTMHGIRLQKLPKSVDFTGEGALTVEVPDISFAKIAGHALIKERLKETIRFLKEPGLLKAHGECPPRGLLLHGPPGTGKTMLAKALAHEADLPFIATTGSDLLHLQLMKKVFSRSREYAPSILFIDEIDAIGARNGGGSDGAINQLLTEIDGFSGSGGVFIIAATNFREKIDPALLRSGRIDLHFHIPALDREARDYFIRMMLEKPLEQGINRERLLDCTAGMTGADLAKVSRESTLESVRRGNGRLTEEIIIETIHIVKYGQRLESHNLEKQTGPIAYHEAGHAVISLILLPDTKVEHVTVYPRENMLGFVSYKDDEEQGNMSRQDFLDRIAVALAGRAAQMKKYGASGCDTGAGSDLSKATRLCHAAIAYFGMDSQVGALNVSSVEDTLRGHLTDLIGERVHAWMKEAEERTRSLVEEYWDQIDSLACRLMREKHVDGRHILSNQKGQEHMRGENK